MQQKVCCHQFGTAAAGEDAGAAWSPERPVSWRPVSQDSLQVAAAPSCRSYIALDLVRRSRPVEPAAETPARGHQPAADRAATDIARLAVCVCSLIDCPLARGAPPTLVVCTYF